MGCRAAASRFGDRADMETRRTKTHAAPLPPLWGRAIAYGIANTLAERAGQSRVGRRLLACESKRERNGIACGTPEQSDRPPLQPLIPAKCAFIGRILICDSPALWGKVGMGGAAAQCQRILAASSKCTASAFRAASPPIQLRLSSLRSQRLRILPPQGGKRSRVKLR